MKSPQERAEEVIRNESWWGLTFNPPGDRKKLSSLIASAIEEAVLEKLTQPESSGERPAKSFHKTK